MSRQFRSDDTSKWLEGFGSGAGGSVTLSGTYSGTAANGCYAYGPCTGTSGQFTLTTPNGWGSGRYYVLIHQTQGTGAGVWELNLITGISGTTSTLKYPLQATYGTGAQVVLAVPYRNLTVGNLTAPAWNGSSGGIIFLLDSGTTTITGTVTGTGKGFRGGARGANSGGDSYQGEGYTSAGGISTAANTVGGGGANPNNAGNYLGAGGGGHAGAGGGGVGGDGVPGSGGNAGGNASLTSMIFGGGGGGGTTPDADPTENGAAGGGIIFIISQSITISGTVSVSGATVTETGRDSHGGAGGGAGGAVLIKAQTATLGTNKIVVSGGGGEQTNASGGLGSYGRIHLDYSVSYSGSTTPTIDVTQDATIKEPQLGGSFLYNFL